jgi:hypothetical protein
MSREAGSPVAWPDFVADLRGLLARDALLAFGSALLLFFDFSATVHSP